MNNENKTPVHHDNDIINKWEKILLLTSRKCQFDELKSLFRLYF